MCKNCFEYSYSVNNENYTLDFNLYISFDDDENKTISYVSIYVEKILYYDDIIVENQASYINILLGLDKKYMLKYELLNIENSPYVNEIDNFDIIEREFIKKKINKVLLNIESKLNIIELFQQEKLL